MPLATSQHDISRRDALRLGALGLSLPGMFALQARGQAAGLNDPGVRSLLRAKLTSYAFPLFAS
jgi:hypothetical protein